MANTELYWQIIQERICSKCIDGDGRGGCRIDSGRECPLQKYFPQIVQVVDSVKSQSVGPYETMLRNKICGICIHQSSEGICPVRDEVECALDRYFPLIVEVIEEARLRERGNIESSEIGDTFSHV